MPSVKALINQFKDQFSQKFVPEPGLYHFQRKSGLEKSRLHLRIDPDGSGLLIINANRMVQLNTTAATMAYLHLECINPDDAKKIIHKQFSVPADQAQSDYLDFELQLEKIIEPNGSCLICDLSLETTQPFTAKPSAPYRMDLAITYRCNNDCQHCYNARSRKFPELTTEEWLRIIDKVWDLRIPHIVFTGGEPTLRKDLPDLVKYAEMKGLITGINTNGRKLADKDFLDTLIQAGLDHVQVTVESHDAEIHDQMVSAKGAWKETINGLKNAIQTPLYLMTNTTMLTLNKHTIEETLHFLAQLGVPTIGLNALIYAGKGEDVGTGLKESELPALLENANQITQSYGQRLIWYTPTQYCHFNPLQLNLGIKGCTAALYNMCIEPNGDVIPCQSYYRALGNLLLNPWNEIWEHPLAVQLRNRADIPVGCQTCDVLPECGGGCPLAREHQTVNPIKNPILTF